VPRRKERRKNSGDGGGGKSQCKARNSLLAEMSSYDENKKLHPTL